MKRILTLLILTLATLDHRIRTWGADSIWYVVGAPQALHFRQIFSAQRRRGMDGTLDTSELLRAAAERYTVFGRVTPKQKQKLVRALQRGGHTVAMTGDGVNDILAMKDADCSVAMSSGSEAAAQVAQVVLLDSDFARMPNVVLEGRQVVNNIQRSASLFLVKNIFSVLMAVFSAVSHIRSSPRRSHL